MKNKKSNIKKKTKNSAACKGVPDDDEWCQAFKDQCDRETIEKLTKRNSKLTDEIIAVNTLLSEVKIDQKLNTKSKDSKKLNEMVQDNKKLAKENVRLQAKLDEEFQNHEKVQDSLENLAAIAIARLTRRYTDEVMAKDSKIFSLEEQIAKLKASSKEVSKVLEQKQLEAKSQLKLKNDQKRELEEKIKKLEKPKQEECPICFEPISIDRKWTAFIPCGHRTCSECADKISALPRSTNKRKCPNCRENIIGFLVLEGIYES